MVLCSPYGSQVWTSTKVLDGFRPAMSHDFLYFFVTGSHDNQGNYIGLDEYLVT